VPSQSGGQELRGTQEAVSNPKSAIQNPKSSRPLLIELPFTVKTYDIDFAQVVSNIVYIRWLEDLRLAFLSAYYPLTDLMADGFSPVLAKTEIEYHRAIRLLDQPTGRMWATALERVRWHVQAEFVVAGEVMTTAVQTGYFVSLETFRPVRLPERLREKWRLEIGD
jgi:acyl-CoA thioester hydrolase